MYAAIGGLKTHMTNLNVIGNNIANVNTAGYKAQRMIFQESIYTTSRAGSDGTEVRGGNTPSQIGYGSQVGSIDLNMSPGTFNPTGVALDCMIEGDGFFLVGNKDLKFDSAEDYTKLQLTRVGDFNIDPMGYVTDGNKNVVYGFKMINNPHYDPNATEKTDANGNNIMDKLILSTELVPLRVPLAAKEPTVENGGIVNGTNRWEAGDPVYDFLGPLMGNGTTGRGNWSLADHPEAFDDTTGALATPGQLPEGIGVPTGADGTVTGTQPYTGPLPNTNDKLVSLNGISINSNGAITGVAENGDTVVVAGQSRLADGVPVEILSQKK